MKRGHHTEKHMMQFHGYAFEIDCVTGHIRTNSVESAAAVAAYIVMENSKRESHINAPAIEKHTSDASTEEGPSSSANGATLTDESSLHADAEGYAAQASENAAIISEMNNLCDDPDEDLKALRSSLEIMFRG